MSTPSNGLSKRPNSTAAAGKKLRLHRRKNSNGVLIRSPTSPPVEVREGLFEDQIEK